MSRCTRENLGSQAVTALLTALVPGHNTRDDVLYGALDSHPSTGNPNLLTPMTGRLLAPAAPKSLISAHPKPNFSSSNHLGIQWQYPPTPNLEISPHRAVRNPLDLLLSILLNFHG